MAEDKGKKSPNDECGPRSDSGPINPGRQDLPKGSQQYFFLSISEKISAFDH